jgi:hypothetical protein
MYNTYMRYKPKTKMYVDFLASLRLTHEEWVERWIAEAMRLAPPKMHTLLEHNGRGFDDYDAATPEQREILQKATGTALDNRLRELRALGVLPRDTKSASGAKH